MYKKQKNFEVKMRRRRLINIKKNIFFGRHFGIRCISVADLEEPNVLEATGWLLTKLKRFIEFKTSEVKSRSQWSGRDLNPTHVNTKPTAKLL